MSQNILHFSETKNLGTKAHPTGQAKVTSYKIPFSCDAETMPSEIYSRLRCKIQDKYDRAPTRLDNGMVEKTARIDSFVMETPVSGHIVVHQTEWYYPAA